jgi:hypothetical protein
MPGRPGDLNGDDQVNWNDFVSLADCLAGPGSAWPPGCVSADLDCDGDVDLPDFAGFQILIGAGN